MGIRVGVVLFWEGRGGEGGREGLGFRVGGKLGYLRACSAAGLKPRSTSARCRDERLQGRRYTSDLIQSRNNY